MGTEKSVGTKRQDGEEKGEKTRKGPSYVAAAEPWCGVVDMASMGCTTICREQVGAAMGFKAWRKGGGALSE